MSSQTQQPKFSIGQTAYHATTITEYKYITCPDCQGTGQLTVVLGDYSCIPIDCDNCEKGWRGSIGLLDYSYNSPSVDKVEITGIELSVTGYEYRTKTHYIVPENRLSTSPEEAMDIAIELVENLNKESLESVKKKEKVDRSWAFNASYHRRCIRDAQKQIDYHSKKLEFAKTKVKEEKANV